jgi:hypothetical protein
MASKKNPLSAMLNSDSRVQAKEFQRDYTVASTIKGVGDYAIGVTKPVPVSQTSMGRLAQSLGAASGLLKEFSDYQIQKDQLDLQSAALKGKIATQEIAGQKALIDLENSKLRGAVTNETIKQQNTQLEMLQQEEAVLEFQDFWKTLPPEERKSFNADAFVSLKTQEEEADKALGKAAVAVSKGGTEEQKIAFMTKYAKQNKGAAYYPDYVEYFKSEKDKKLGSVDDTSLTSEEAGALADEILNTYITDVANFENGSEELKGFLKAASGFNEKNFASLASEGQAKAAAISQERLVYSLFNTAENGLFNSNQLAQLQISSAKEGGLESLLFGPKGVLKSIENSKNQETLSNFSKIFHDQLGGLNVDGRPFRESSLFGAAGAAIEEAATNMKKDALTKEKLDEDLSDSLIGDIAKELAVNYTNKEGREILMGAISGKREDLIKLSPDKMTKVLDMNPDEDRLDVTIKLRTLFEEYSSEKSFLANSFISENSETFLDLSKPQYTTGFFKKIKRSLDSVEGNTEASEILNKWLGESGLNPYSLSLFNRYSGGVIDRYRDAVEALPEIVKEKHPNTSTKEAKDFLNQELDKINETLEEDVIQYTKGQVRARAEIREDPPTYLDINEVNKIIKMDPLRPIESIKEEEEREAIKQREAEREAVSKISIEELHENNEKLRELANKGSIITSRKYNPLAPAYTHYSKSAASLLTRSIFNLNPLQGTTLGVPSGFRYAPNNFYIDEEKRYKKAHFQAELSEKLRIRTGIDAAEALDIAQTADSLPEASAIPILMKEESFNYKDVEIDAGTRLLFTSEYLEENVREHYATEIQDKLKDITIPRSLFFETIPPIRDLNLGKDKPSSQEDVIKAQKDLGLTEKQLLEVAELYGHEDALEFLKSQYETPFHNNKRK